MGLASALSTALTGLTAAETTIDVVGNNLANTNTVGFKASTATFATQFLQTLSLGSAPTTNSGGTNPRQIGLGAMVADITPDFNQGTIEISSSPTDLAIQGEGFFIVEGSSGQQLFTRNGIFKMNSQSELVTITGNRLLGYGIDDQFEIQTTALQALTIPLGATAVAQPTSNVFLEGTLSPTGDLADRAAIIETGILGNGAFTAPSATGMEIDASNVPNLLGPPPMGVVGGAGGVMTPGQAYLYRIVFADGQVGAITDTEGMFSADSPITLGAGENQVVFSNIPVDPDGTPLTTRRIYRSHDGGTNFYRVAEIADNVTTAFTDTMSDAVAATQDALDTTVLTGAYSYYVTFADAPGGYGFGTESRPTQLDLSENVVNGRVQLRDLPVDASGQWAVRRIYRNIATDDSTFYYVGEVSDATTANMAFSDSIADAVIENPARKLDFDGPKISSSTLLINILRYDGTTYNQVFTGEGTLEFTGRKGGRTLTSKEFTVTSASTVLDLNSFVEESMGIRRIPGLDPSNPIPSDSSGANPGASVTAAGKIRLVGNNGVANALEIGLSGMQLITSSGTDNVDMPFSTTRSAIGESTVADFIAYDSLGIPLQVRLTAVLESRNSTSTTYRWFADSPDNDPSTGVQIGVGTGLISFDGEGNFTTTSEATVSIDRRNVSSATPLEFEINFSQLSGLAAGSSSLAISRQDGSGPGVLTSFIVGEDGGIRGVFSNGVVRNLGQIRLARFGNPSGMEQKGQNLYATGVGSGLPVEGNPGERGIGSIIAGAQELSNTDIGANLIDLILASTMYRGNTRVITTVQQLFDELLALRR